MVVFSRKNIVAFVLSTLAASGFAEISEITDSQSMKSKLISTLQEHGSVKLDASITDEMAESIYNNFINGDSSSAHAYVRRGLDDDGWTEEDKEMTLEQHNSYRATVASGNQKDDGTDGTYPEASNMNSLFWDPAIASVAQAYSDECNYGHNGNRNTDFFSHSSDATFDYGSSITLGENIAAYFTSSNSISDSYLTDRVDAWWEEATLTHHSDSFSYVSGAGHFTQMAWAKTRYLGCGFSYCDYNGYNMFYLVCDYYPAGNYVGSSFYEEGTCSKSDCDGDRTVTCSTDELCSGCMDPAYTTDGSTNDASTCSDGFNDFDGGTDDTDTGDDEDTVSGDDCGCTGDSTNNDKTITMSGVEEVEYGTDVFVYNFNGEWAAEDGCYNDKTYYSLTVPNQITGVNEQFVLFWYSWYWKIAKALYTDSPWAYCTQATLTDCDGSWNVFRVYTYESNGESVVSGSGTCAGTDYQRSGNSVEGSDDSSNVDTSSNSDSSNKDLEWWVWLVISIAIVCVFAGAIVGFVLCRRNQNRKDMSAAEADLDDKKFHLLADEPVIVDSQ